MINNDAKIKHLKWLIVYFGSSQGKRITQTQAFKDHRRRDPIAFTKEFGFHTEYCLSVDWLESAPGPRGGQGFRITPKGAKAVMDFHATKIKPKPRKHKAPAGHCRVCGCTEDRACADTNAHGDGCHWVEPDLCNVCKANPIAMAYDEMAELAAQAAGKSQMAFPIEKYAPATASNLKQILRAMRIAIQTQRLSDQVTAGWAPPEVFETALKRILSGQAAFK